MGVRYSGLTPSGYGSWLNLGKSWRSHCFTLIASSSLLSNCGGSFLATASTRFRTAVVSLEQKPVAGLGNCPQATRQDNTAFLTQGTGCAPRKNLNENLIGHLTLMITKCLPVEVKNADVPYRCQFRFLNRACAVIGIITLISCCLVDVPTHTKTEKESERETVRSI